jgi:radical SAM protein with 4Fe4S-binding SPASM domain
MAKLINARDLRGERRERLVDAVPLPAPWTMFIEPTNACNYRCKYCPTGHPELLRQVGRKNTLMSWELFTDVVDGMREFPRRLRMVNLYKDGEPLIHPNFCEMVKYLRGANVTEKIWVKTNGQLLAPELNERLATCGLDMIGVSVQAVTAQGFYDIAGVRVDYNKYRAGVKDLFDRCGTTKVSVKIADVGLSEDDRQKFLDDFSDSCDFITIEGLHGWSASERGDFRMGTENSFDGTPRTNKIACPLTLYMLTVNSNGKVSICNDDWMQVHNIGDVNTQSLHEIWYGTKLREFRMMHLWGNRDANDACRNCDYLAALPDSIDGDLEEIKRAYR